MKRFYRDHFSDYIFKHRNSKKKYNFKNAQQDQYEELVRDFIEFMGLRDAFSSPVDFRYLCLIIYSTKHKEDSWYKPSEDPTPDYKKEMIDIYNSNSAAKLQVFFEVPIVRALFKYFYENFKPARNATFEGFFAEELDIDEERITEALNQHTSFCFEAL